MSGSASRAARRRTTIAAAVAVALVLVPDAWVWARGRSARRIPPGWAPDLILVPGASVLRNGRPSPVLRQRVETALGASRRWPAARLVLSGSALGGYDEPGSMRRYLLEHAVDSSRLVLDRRGNSSSESVRNLGKPSGRLLVVSQSWHIPRLGWLARGEGWDVRGLDAEEEGAIQGGENLLRENIVRAANFWEGLFRASVRSSR